MPVYYKTLYCYKTLLILGLFFFSCINIYGQFLKPGVKQAYANNPFFDNLKDGIGKNIHYSRLKQADSLNTGYKKANDNTVNCNTSTFYMRIPALAGEKIELKELQTLPGGDFIAVGNTISAANQKNGLIVRLNNIGVIISQQQLIINNKPTIVFNMKVTLQGAIIIAGIINDGSNEVFVLKLNNDLSTDWIKMFKMPSTPFKTTIDLYSDDAQQIIFATQLGSSIICSALTLEGTLRWNREFVISGLTGLAGFSELLGTLGLVTNLVSNGKELTQVSEINRNDGSLLKSGILGDGMEQNKCFETTPFNARLHLLGVKKTQASGFELVRNIIYNALVIETQHVYTIPGNVDLDISGAMDNAADALGFCLPKDGKLIFIRHFSYSQTTPEYTRQYSVPVGSNITAVARSLADGGYLFGLDTKDSGEIILIKTDSIGILAGCGYQDISNDFKETFVKQNILSITLENNISLATDDVPASLTNANLSIQFNCDQNYCPVQPIDDSCLSTYFKTMRSNSYVDAFGRYSLMRNNRQLITTTRYDRILGNMNQVTAGIKLFDERGNFIKGVNVFLDGISSGFDTRQMDDKSILLNSYSTKNNLPRYTFTLVSDDLQILWSKSFEISVDNNYGSDGPGSQDWHKDEEGNCYFVSVNPGYMSKPKLFVYKMDASGRQLWLKAWEFEKSYFGTAKMVSTKSSVIVIIDGSNGGSTSVRLDKTNGQILNSFLYQNTYAGYIYNRVVKFDGDRIFYAGNTNTGQFLLGLFDTTGRPLKLRSVNNYNTIPRAGNVKNGMMYISLDHYDGFQYNDVILKVDPTLNIVYAHEYPMQRYRLASGLGVSENGNIYEAGNFSYGGVNGSYYDPYIIKYDNDGEIGTCNYTAVIPAFTDIDPQTQNLSYSAIPIAFQPIDIPLTLVPDSYGQTISEILCSSVPQCNFIKIKGPAVVCSLNTDYTFTVQKNSTCNLQPVWFYDTSFATLHSPTDSTVKFSFKKVGAVWLKARLNAGCTYYDDSILVQVQKTPASFTLGIDTLFCPGDSILLNAGTGFNSYLWQDGSTDSLFIVKTPGQYFVQTKNLCGNAYADTILISSAIIPALYIGSDTAVCAGDTLQLNSSAGFSIYNWQPQSGIIGQGSKVSVIPVQQQLFTLQAVTAEGCFAADSILINVIKAKPVYLGADTSFCDYDSITLNAGNGYSAYNWSTGSTATSITVTTMGSFRVTAQDTNGCFAHDTLVVSQLYAHPVINLGPDTDLCNGSFLILDAGSFINYHWQDGSALRTYTASKPGVYAVTAIDNNTCSGSDSIEIKSLLPLPANFLQPTDSLCQFDKLQIKPLQDFVAYNWSTGSMQPYITVEQPGLIGLKVTDVNGCSGSDTIKVIQKECMMGVFIPSAFTPNADQRNDVFRAKVFGVVISFRMQVHNRFGQLIFATTDPYKGWDGTYNGKLQDTGTFTWQCSYELEGSKAMFQKGSVVLIR